MDAGIVAGEVAEGRRNGAPQADRAGGNLDYRAVGVAIQSRVDGLDGEPVAASRRHVAEDPCRAVNLRDEKVRRPVVVEVTQGKRSINARRTAKGGFGR